MIKMPRKEQSEYPATPVPGTMREPGFSHKRSGVKAVVFDCFGVLAEDGWTPFKRRYIGANNELATQIADLGKQNEFGIISNDEYFDTASKLLGTEKNLLREAVGRRVPNEELFAYIKTVLKPQYKIGLLSNANYDVVQNLFTPEQSSLFDATVLSFESRLVKPDPAMYRLIAERLGVEPEECVFIDDQERYAEAAEDVGMRGLTYVSAEQTRQDLEGIGKAQ